MYKADLSNIFLAQNKEQKALSEINVLKLEHELMKIKNSTASSKDSSKSENDKLNESLKPLKILHKEQLQLK